jgi:hypothetical protein
MPTPAVGGKRPNLGLTPLQAALHDLAAVIEAVKSLNARERSAFASIGEQMLVRSFAGELAVLEAERWVEEAAA